MQILKKLVPLLILLIVVLSGCSIESIISTGSDVLDKAFTGDSDSAIKAEEPVIPPQTISSPEDSNEADGSGEPSTDESDISSVPANQEPVVSGEPILPPEETPTETIEPSHTDITFFGPGESIKFIPKGISGTYSCTYATENESIASVNQETGKVTAVGPGTTTVSMHVEYNGQYDFSCIVRCNWSEDKEPTLPPDDNKRIEQVVNPKTEDSKSDSTKPAAKESADGLISANYTDATFFNPKEHFTLLPVGIDDADCIYTSANPEIVTVDDKGVVRAVAPGTTTVTMTVDGGGTEYIFECIVRCKWTAE